MTDITKPTFDEMVAAGVSASLARSVIAQRDRETAKAKRKFVDDKQAEELPCILGMTADQEAASMRFMDDHSGRYNGIFAPSDLWTIAYCAIMTSHQVRILPAFQLKEYPQAIVLPCGFNEIMAFAVRPSLSEEEAMHRADCFAKDVMDRARALYRDGFYADPFTSCPLQRSL